MIYNNLSKNNCISLLKKKKDINILKINLTNIKKKIKKRYEKKYENLLINLILKSKKFKKNKFFLKKKNKKIHKKQLKYFRFTIKNIKFKNKTKYLNNYKELKSTAKLIRFVGINFRYNFNKFRNYKLKNNLIINKKYIHNFFYNIQNYKKYFLFNKLKYFYFINKHQFKEINNIFYKNIIYNYKNILSSIKNNLYFKKNIFNVFFSKNFINLNIMKIISKLYQLKKDSNVKYKFILYDLNKILKKGKEFRLKKKRKKRNYIFSKIIDSTKKNNRSRVIQNYLNINSTFNNIKIKLKTDFNLMNFFKKNNFLKNNMKKMISLKNNFKFIRKNLIKIDQSLLILLYKTRLFKTFNEIKNELKLKNIQILKKNYNFLILKFNNKLKNKLLLRILNNIKKKNYLKKIPNFIDFELNSFLLIFNFNLMKLLDKNNFIKNILLSDENINIIRYSKNKSLKISKMYKINLL